MFNPFAIFKRQPELTPDSDYGRRYGWFIERDGVPIGELDYLGWDRDSDFSPDYRLSWFNPDDAVIGPEAWLAAKLTLRSRRYLEIVIDGFLPSPEFGESVIRVLWAHVSIRNVRLGPRGKNSVFDRALGLLVYSEDDDVWECTVLIGENAAQLQIGGDDKPSPTLIAHAQEIVRDGAGFMRMVDEFSGSAGPCGPRHGRRCPTTLAGVHLPSFTRASQRWDAVFSRP